MGEAILATVREHASGRSQFDDITLVCFGRNAEVDLEGGMSEHGRSQQPRP